MKTVPRQELIVYNTNKMVSLWITLTQNNFFANCLCYIHTKP